MPDQIALDDLVPLFDALPDVVFFAKDTQGRYTHVNATLVRRLRLDSRADIIDKRTSELFPAAMGAAYLAQDRQVLAGKVIDNRLEVHIFGNRAPGWCVTSKWPLWAHGRIDGVIGISRDLGQPNGLHPTYDRIRRIVDYMERHYGDRIRVTELARRAHMSVAQLERHFRYVFQLTPQQLLTKVRIEAAMERLAGDDAIAAIGLACGYVDQSAFARQFRATMGMTPRAYRKLLGNPGGSSSKGR